MLTCRLEGKNTHTETFGCEGQDVDAYMEWTLLREAFVKSIVYRAMRESVL